MAVNNKKNKPRPLRVFLEFSLANYIEKKERCEKEIRRLTARKKYYDDLIRSYTRQVQDA